MELLYVLLLLVAVVLFVMAGIGVTLRRGTLLGWGLACCAAVWFLQMFQHV